MTRKLKRRRWPLNGLSAWQRSAVFHEIGRKALTSWNRKRHRLPKCGAARRYDGQPCQQVAMKNGRCYFHGGATPRGKEWHLTRWPSRSSPHAAKKLHAKVCQRERAARARQRLIEAMTPAQRARHDRWQATHSAGAKAARAGKAEEMRRNVEARKLLAKARLERQDNPEFDRLGREIDRLRVEASRLEQRNAFRSLGGVFE